MVTAELPTLGERVRILRGLRDRSSTGEHLVCTQVMRVRFSPVPLRPWPNGRAPEKLNETGTAKAECVGCGEMRPLGDVQGMLGVGGLGPGLRMHRARSCQGACREARFPRGAFARTLRVRLPSAAPTPSALCVRRGQDLRSPAVQARSRLRLPSAAPILEPILRRGAWSAKPRVRV
jgi:hypothetical protein